MGINHTKSNNERTLKLFYKKIVYKNDLKGFGNHVMDFTYAEKFLYGRVSRYYVPVILKTENEIVQLSGEDEQGIGALNFVVHAFKDMNLQFKKRSKLGIIKSDDPYLSNLRVHKGYENPEILYEQYHKSYSDVLKKRFTKDNIAVLNFDVFLTNLQNIIFSGEGVRRMPFTQPAFIKSRLCPINCSGLVIEIADLKFSNDDDKYEKFVNSPNWQFYVNAANDHGFMIDRNAPWRLVADINSLGMQRRMELFAPNAMGSTAAFLNAFYKSSPPVYYINFKRYLLNLYDKVRLNFYTIPSACGKGSPTLRNRASKRYSMQTLTQEYSEEDFLRLYFKIRLAEEETQFSEAKKLKLMNDSIEIYNANRNLTSALFVFERILNLPFDYNGSMSYYINRLKKKEATEDAPAGGGY